MRPPCRTLVDLKTQIEMLEIDPYRKFEESVSKPRGKCCDTKRGWKKKQQQTNKQVDQLWLAPCETGRAGVQPRRRRGRLVRGGAADRRRRLRGGADGRRRGPAVLLRSVGPDLLDARPHRLLLLLLPAQAQQVQTAHAQPLQGKNRSFPDLDVDVGSRTHSTRSSMIVPSAKVLVTWPRRSIQRNHDPRTCSSSSSQSEVCCMWTL